MRRVSATNSSAVRSVRNPGMASSLSRVPPVCPRPRPTIIGTAAPQADTQGARAIEILSPTPPVECLSTVGRPIPFQPRIRPEWSMASVRATVSSRSMPRIVTAMRSAADS